MIELTGNEQESPILDTEGVKSIASGCATVVEGLATILAYCHAHLLVPPDEGEMLEGEKPYDLATDLRGSIECVTNDGLRYVHRILTEMSKATEESVRRGWRSRDTSSVVPDGEVGGDPPEAVGNLPGRGDD